MAQPNEPASTAADPLVALTAALKLLLPNQPATTLQTPTFEWTTSNQYDEFKLFQESMESLFHLQAIPDEPDEKKGPPPGVYTKFPWYHWPPEMEPVDTWQCDHRWYCSYQEEHESFLDHLASQMEHAVPQHCHIYQLEDVQIKAGETPGWIGRSSESPHW